MSPRETFEALLLVSPANLMLKTEPFLRPNWFGLSQIISDGTSPDPGDLEADFQMTLNLFLIAVALSSSCETQRILTPGSLTIVDRPMQRSIVLRPTCLGLTA